eukprot:3338612-Rhodomonas_salina.1
MSGHVTCQARSRHTGHGTGRASHIGRGHVTRGGAHLSDSHDLVLPPDLSHAKAKSAPRTSEKDGVFSS